MTAKQGAKGNLLGYKRFRVGDKVRVLGGRFTSQIIADGVGVAFWDFKKGNTGTVIEVTRFGKLGKSAPSVIVKPDSEFGFGPFTFSAKEIELVERPT